MTLQEEDAKQLLRDRGMCGHVADGQICILSRGHDQGTHDRGWTVEKRVQDDPYAHDSRCSITVYCVSDGTKTFETDSKEHADWLAGALTRLDAGGSLVAAAAVSEQEVDQIREMIQSQGWHENTAVDLMVEYLRQETENFHLVHAHDAVDALIAHIASFGGTRGLIAFLQDSVHKEESP